MKRRDFVCLVGAGSVMPLAIASCANQTKETITTSSPLNTARSDGFQMVGTVSDLNSKGQILLEKTPTGKVLVIPNPTNPNNPIAVNPTCNHASCSVAWQKAEKTFVCPCHDSKFATDGKVLQGPADKPLSQYIAKIEGDSVLVKIS